MTMKMMSMELKIFTTLWKNNYTSARTRRSRNTLIEWDNADLFAKYGMRFYHYV